MTTPKPAPVKPWTEWRIVNADTNVPDRFCVYASKSEALDALGPHGLNFYRVIRVEVRPEEKRPSPETVKGKRR